MSRLPIRVRLTLAFAVAMAVVLAATGAFLYTRLSTSLDEAIDESLQARSVELVPRLADGEAGLGAPTQAGLGDPDERFVQVLAESGAVVETTPPVGSGRLLDGPTLARAADAGVTELELDDVPGIAGGRARVLATRVETPGGVRILLVGASLEDRDETIRGFLTELLVVGPAALLLASLLGYALATAALRPVEAMRAEASTISGSEPGRRLPLPTAKDEVHRLGETLNQMLGRLEVALERERSFVADAGHELRTPLALLKAELELALRRPRSPHELETAIRSAADETDRLARLAEDLLLLARSDRERLPLRRERVQVSDVLRRIAARFARRSREAKRAIEVEAPEALRLEADAARLEQALGNLVDNALNYGLGSVRISAAEHDGWIELHVIDDGAGFPPAFLPRAFDRFARADDARSGGGTGLGLTIVDAVARAHGGFAQVANREGGGADVWLSLPGVEVRARELD